ncbi:TniQ family protein [Variovorax sp. RB3P1]|uniref:TniQ family protein n=1 Tax=Variovorax sp. RB3P1 TaxID=3443732 RepID=UPI003F46F491
MTTQFLVRPRPFEGESLSSWRQRTAARNGFRLYPTEIGELRRSDPDFGHSADVLKSIAYKSRLAAKDLMPLCLSSLEGKVFLATRMREHPNWILRTRYSHGTLIPGPSYCPFCVGVESPYFRLEWRVAFVTTCRCHGCELLDACPQCGAGVWPVGANSEKRFAGKHMPLGICLECGTPLGAPANDLGIPLLVSADDQLWAARLLAGEPQHLNDSLCVSSADYLMGLDALCHLFIRRRALERLSKSSAPWGELTKDCFEQVPVNQIEYLGIAARRRLINALRPLLRDWPSRFVEFAAITRLTQEHFSGSESLMPFWMAKFVDENLRRQRRGVDTARVQAEADVLRLEGRRVTKAALRARLGNAGAINAAVLYRKAATDYEKRHLLRVLDSDLERCAASRISYAALLRNQYFILLAIAMQKSLVQVVEIERIDSGDAQLVLSKLVEGEQGRSSWLPPDAIQRRFQALTIDRKPEVDVRDCARAAQRALCLAMKSMDSMLLRRIGVFW